MDSINGTYPAELQYDGIPMVAPATPSHLSASLPQPPRSIVQRGVPQMPLVSALGSGDCLSGVPGSGRQVMQPLCVNVVGGSPRAPAEADRIVALLVRCHSQRRHLKNGGADSTPRSRAIFAEAKALASPELEQLRQFKERVTSAEWARLKKRAKAAAVAESQNSRAHSLTGTVAHGIASGVTTPRSGGTTQCNRKLKAAVVQLKKQEAELSVKNRLIEDLQSELQAVKIATETRTDAANVNPGPAAGTLVSAPCKEMLKNIDTEAKVIIAGVSNCLEKELNSGEKDDMDIAAMHELEVWAQRAQDLCKDATLLAPVLPPHLLQLGPELRAHSEYVRTLRNEVQGRVFARREKAYTTVLAGQHEVVAVPADGNCFFWSAIVANSALDPQDEHNTELTTARARRLIASNCVDKVHALRSRVCQYMRENISSLKKDMVEACLEALSQQSVSNLRSNLIEQLGSCIQLQTSGSWDGTEDALCACAQMSLQSTSNSKEDTAIEACEIYCNTFDSPGVFAERLQVQCLCDLWGRAIRLYYYTGGEQTPAKGAAVSPAEVFYPICGNRDPGESCEAISLLHYPSARHFDVIFEQRNVEPASDRARHESSSTGVRPLDLPEETQVLRHADMMKQDTKRRQERKSGEPFFICPYTCLLTYASLSQRT